MHMKEYTERFDSLAAEDALFEIPLRKEFILQEIGSGKRVLDVGCLGGKISRMIMEQHNEVWGIELNPRAAEVARSRGVMVKVADVEDGMPFDDQTFDVVNAGEILEHLYDTKSFLQDCRRVLKPNGVLIFTTPNLNSLENRVKVLAGQYPDMIGAYPEDHFGSNVRIFNPTKIRELSEQAGLKVETMLGIPALKPQGKMLDGALRLAGRLAPGLSKLLIVKARRV